MNKTNLILFFTDLILFSLYIPINQSFGEVYSFRITVDDYIPLITEFTWIYLSYFVFLLLLVIFFIKQKLHREMTKVLFGIGIACITAYLFYAFFQNSVIRPDIVSKNISDDLYLLLNTKINIYNAFPSLHVAISLICLHGLFVVRSKFFKIAAVWVFLIIISTVLTKQHYFLDIIGGVIVSLTSVRLGEFITRKIYKK